LSFASVTSLKRLRSLQAILYECTICIIGTWHFPINAAFPSFGFYLDRF
jgi:hypothetical protein